MQGTTVTLYIRPRRMPDGSRPYLRPAQGKNNRIRAGKAIYKGQEMDCPGADYYLRYRQDGRAVYQRVGRDLEVAQTAKLKREKTLEAIAAGVVIPAERPKLDRSDLLSARIRQFVDFLEASGRAVNTITEYVYLLEHLLAALGDKQMSEITKDDLLGRARVWKAQVRLVNGEQVRLVNDTTIWYRLRRVRTFLLHFDRDVLKRSEFPRFDEKVPDTYSAHQLQRFFASCSAEEHLCYALLFGTGMRRGELANLRWENVDLERGLITIQATQNWKTKTRRARRVPIPAELLETLRVRRSGRRSDLYVVGDGARPLLDLLKPLKRIALHAGLNCGFCISKAGKSCATNPCCARFTVQKLRRSYATHLHEGGTSINTLRVLLGHKSPAPILRYLAPQDIQSPELLRKTHEEIDPESGKRIRIQNPKSEWLIREAPELRIISDDLWQAVQEKRRAKTSLIGVQRSGGMSRTPESRRYLLSGLMTCGVCGNKIIVVTSSPTRYGCAEHRYRGGCSNKATLPQPQLELAFVAALSAKLRSEALREPRVTPQLPAGGGVSMRQLPVRKHRVL